MRPSVPKEQLAEFCRRHHILKLALFGSILREDFRPDSDIDVLVEFEPGHVPGFGFIRLQEVLRTAEVQYAAGRRVHPALLA
jgi:uncharacterized protein